MRTGEKNPIPHWIPRTLIYLLFLLPSLYALAALAELDVRMGHGSGMYSDYGRTDGEKALAIGFTVVYMLWVTLGTIVAIRVFKGEWALRWLGLLAALAIFVMLPVALVYLLGVGHF